MKGDWTKLDANLITTLTLATTASFLRLVQSIIEFTIQQGRRLMGFHLVLKLLLSIMDMQLIEDSGVKITFEAVVNTNEDQSALAIDNL